MLHSKEIGAFHVCNGLPCQDNSIACTFSTNTGIKGAIFAIADGHGAAQHDLSEFGSKIAVQETIDAIYRLMQKQTNTEVYKILIYLEENFPAEITQAWRKKVMEHYESMISKSDTKAFPGSGSEDYSAIERYGTTLTVGVLVQDYLLICSIGDGTVCMKYFDGTFEMLWREYEDTRTNFTDSLCQSDADRRFKAAIGRGIEEVLISSDGMVTSFEDISEFLKVLPSIDSALKVSVAAASDRLNTIVLNCATDGSCDDVVALFIKGCGGPERVKSPTHEFGVT